jgi:hypothetical protein
MTEITGETSDGYHTFNELYAHRGHLFVALCAALDSGYDIWRSKSHADGSSYPGFFIMGIGKVPGRQITYHMPDGYWALTEFAETLERAPEWDNHTPVDVLTRLRRITYQESN